MSTKSASHSRTHLTLRRWLLPAVLITLATAPAAAQTGQSSEAFMIAQGRVTYRVYCANCHGDDALGDGNLAEYLTVEPTDLTLLKKKNRGVFPTDEVFASVDGRKQVRGHGLKEMPVWGDAFQKVLQPTWKDESNEQRATRKVHEVVAFLKSIQQNGEDARSDE